MQRAMYKSTPSNPLEPSSNRTSPTWSDYFDVCEDVAIEENSFRVYRVRPDEQKGPLFVVHHGGGHSALSWAIFARELKLLKPDVSVLAYDCRGHGATRHQDETNLSLEALSADLRLLLDKVYPHRQRDVVLVGHSLGGAVVVDAASKGLLGKILGVVVLDLVEGTAMESLGHMHSILKNRPTSFKSIDEAIRWNLHSGALHNKASALVSVPPQLVESVDSLGRTNYTWRANLAASDKYWEGWFLGLSDKFLAVKGARLLVLAGTDRLDKPLTIGQMQGKFQMEILQCGHCIHEDAPAELAGLLIEFWRRNQPLDLSKIKKVAINS